MGGKVYLVGAGPGCAGLVTARGRALLGRAEVLVFDSPVPEAVLEPVPASAERVPVGRWPDVPWMDQGQLNALMIERARAGRLVVRLKNGDPFFFGRGSEEAEALSAAGVEYEVVPGVPSAVAAAALAGIPFTHKGIASEVLFAFVQATDDVSKWGLDLDLLAVFRGTRVLYLSPEQLPALAQELARRGLNPSTPAALVESASGPEQRVLEGPLAQLAARWREARPPAVLFLGRAAGHRRPWAEKRPLDGRCVVLTRPRAQSLEMAAALEERGAEAVVFPCIDLAPPESYEPLDRAIASLGRYDWVAFTSANGVDAFLSRLSALGKDARALGAARLAVVGAATAEALQKAHLRPDVIPPEYTALALARLLAERSIRGQRCLVVRAQEGREVLPEELAKLGALVDVVPAYRTVRPEVNPEEIRRLARRGRLSAVVFASPSAVRNFAAAFAPCEARVLLQACAAAAIGPVTAAALEELGVRAAVQPRESTAEALVESLAAHFRTSAK